MALSFIASAQCMMTLPIITNVSCNGTNDGAVDIIISCPATFVWNDGYIGMPRTGLAAGTYSVTVYDQSPYSTVYNNINVLNSTPVTITGSNSTNIICPGTCSGTASVTATSSGTLSYSWSNGATSNQVNSLCAGTYTVTVSNSSGCTAVQSFNITNTPLNSSAWQKNTKNLSGNDDIIKKVIKDDDGYIYVLGEFTGESSIDGYVFAAGGNTIQQRGMFLAKYDKCGDQLWVVHMENTSNSFYDIEGIDIDFTGFNNEMALIGKWENINSSYVFKFTSTNGSSLSIGAGNTQRDVFSVFVNMNSGQINAIANYNLDFYNKYTAAKTYGNSNLYIGGNINGYAKVIRIHASTMVDIVKDDNLGNIVGDFEINNNGTEVYAAVNLSSTSAKLDGINSISAQGDAIILKAPISPTLVWLPPSFVRPAYGPHVIINDIDINLNSYNLVTAVGKYKGNTPNWSTSNTQISSGIETALIAQFRTNNLANSGTYQMVGSIQSASANAVTTEPDAVIVTGIMEGDIGKISTTATSAGTNVGVPSGINTMWVAKFTGGPVQIKWLAGTKSPKDVVVNDVAYDFKSDLFYIGGGYSDEIVLPPYTTLPFPFSTGSSQLGYIVRGGELLSPGQGAFYKTALGNETDQQLPNVENKISMYPNPNNGTFNLNVESEFTGTLQIAIYNVNGTNVYSNVFDKSSNTFDQQLSINELTAGIYMMHITINGTTQYQKFMIK